MKTWLRRHWLAAAGALAGATAGVAYAHFVGCSTGGCFITSSPWTAGPFGALVGGLLFSPRR